MLCMPRGSAAIGPKLECLLLTLATQTQTCWLQHAPPAHLPHLLEPQGVRLRLRPRLLPQPKPA